MVNNGNSDDNNRNEENETNSLKYNLLKVNKKYKRAIFLALAMI